MCEGMYVCAHKIISTKVIKEWNNIFEKGFEIIIMLYKYRYKIDNAALQWFPTLFNHERPNHLENYEAPSFYMLYNSYY